MITRNYVEIFKGGKSRIISKRTALAAIQYINNIKIGIIQNAQRV